MASSDYGPSWRDCNEAIQYLRDEYARCVEVRVVTPARRMDGAGYTSWGVFVRSTSLQGDDKDVVWHREYWGSGGSHKTATAALHRCITEIVATLARRKEVAEQRALF